MVVALGLRRKRLSVGAVSSAQLATAEPTRCRSVPGRNNSRWAPRLPGRRQVGTPVVASRDATTPGRHRCCSPRPVPPRLRRPPPSVPELADRAAQAHRCAASGRCRTSLGADLTDHIAHLHRPSAVSRCGRTPRSQPVRSCSARTACSCSAVNPTSIGGSPRSRSQASTSAAVTSSGVAVMPAALARAELRC